MILPVGNKMASARRKLSRWHQSNRWLVAMFFLLFASGTVRADVWQDIDDMREALKTQQREIAQAKEDAKLQAQITQAQAKADAEFLVQVAQEEADAKSKAWREKMYAAQDAADAFRNIQAASTQVSIPQEAPIFSEPSADVIIQRTVIKPTPKMPNGETVGLSNLFAPSPTPVVEKKAEEPVIEKPKPELPKVLVSYGSGIAAQK